LINEPAGLKLDRLGKRAPRDSSTRSFGDEIVGAQLRFFIGFRELHIGASHKNRLHLSYVKRQTKPIASSRCLR
jgi:hypothetical protein